MADVDAKLRPKPKPPLKEQPRITHVTIEYAQGIMDLRYLNGSARALLTLSDNKTYAFEWFHDEIAYTEQDFLNKTMHEVHVMHRERDIAYLRS